MDQQELIDELRERIARLEAVKPRRRAYNQQDAARELGMSVNKFRAEQKAGRIRGTLSSQSILPMKSWSDTSRRKLRATPECAPPSHDRNKKPGRDPHRAPGIILRSGQDQWSI